MITRYIYVYREADTRRPVYVGSAFDVARRDKIHVSSGRRGSNVPFDNELFRRGRKAFTLETIASVAGKNAVEAMCNAVPLENEWMNKLSTFRTPHGFNFKRADVIFDVEDRWKARNEANRASKSTPEARNFHKTRMRMAWADPKSRALRVASMNVASVKEKHSKTAAALMNNPQFKERCTVALRTPEARIKAGESIRRFHINNPHVMIERAAAIKATKASRRCYYGA